MRGCGEGCWWIYIMFATNEQQWCGESPVFGSALLKASACLLDNLCRSQWDVVCQPGSAMSVILKRICRRFSHVRGRTKCQSYFYPPPLSSLRRSGRLHTSSHTECVSLAVLFSTGSQLLPQQCSKSLGPQLTLNFDGPTVD